MRIGLYGMPSAGKSTVLQQINFFKVVEGSRLLRELNPEFDSFNEMQKTAARKNMAAQLMKEDGFILDGHYAFGDKVVFTEEDGQLYDVFLYLYISPSILRERWIASEKNMKYLMYDIDEWQKREINGLREYCHRNKKDFYVIDNPPEFCFDNVNDVVCFIHDIVNGYSCAAYAKRIANDIIRKTKSDTIRLYDGDKTLTIEDSSNAVFGYRTHLYDGNYYTGFQTWKQNKEFQRYSFSIPSQLPVRFNTGIVSTITDGSFILTSGHERIWRLIADQLSIPFYGGSEMSAETKFYVTTCLQESGKRVIAYGDGMNDYYMLKQADEGYLVTKQDGSISRSLNGRDLEGIHLV